MDVALIRIAPNRGDLARVVHSEDVYAVDGDLATLLQVLDDVEHQGRLVAGDEQVALAELDALAHAEDGVPEAPNRLLAHTGGSADRIYVLGRLREEGEEGLLVL